MTVENVEALEASVIRTTEGYPGVTTRVTGARTAATQSLDYGLGIINPERIVTSTETTIIDRRIGQAALLGLGVALTGALFREEIEKRL